MKNKVLAALAAVTLLGACQTTTNPSPTTAGPKQTSGALIGAVAGGLLGNEVAGKKHKALGTGIGVLVGAMAGSSIGASMDQVDRMYMNQAGQRALESMPSNQGVAWSNPDSGNYGEVTPVRTFNRQGTYCREFTQTVVIGGNRQQAYGTACRRPDGTWQVIS